MSNWNWKNFHVWRGRLPHWRADDVTYYATFRHSRALLESERRILLSMLVKPDGRQWDLLIVCVLPERTELLFRVIDVPAREKSELSDILEKAKTRAGKQIVKQSGERFPPFYGESYDRIVRDASEVEERWQDILNSPVREELVEDPEQYESLWVNGA